MDPETKQILAGLTLIVIVILAIAAAIWMVMT